MGHLPLFHFFCSHTQITVRLAHTHSWCVFWVCVKLYSVTLGKVASQSELINVWNISSLIFEQVHSSDFAWWWCIIKCWHSITVFAYEFFFSLFHSRMAHFSWLDLVVQIYYLSAMNCWLPSTHTVYNSSHAPNVWGIIKATIQCRTHIHVG